VGSQIVSQTNAYGILVDTTLQKPAPGLGILHRLCQHLSQKDDIHATMSHGVDKGEMFDTGLLDPDDIIEKQLMTVRRR